MGRLAEVVKGHSLITHVQLQAAERLFDNWPGYYVFLKEGTNVNETETKAVIERLGGWKRMIVLSGVILTVPLFALLGTAIYSIVTDRPAASVGVTLSVAALLVLWAIVWGLLWIVSGFKGQLSTSEAFYLAKLEESERENTRLKEKLSELSSDES